MLNSLANLPQNGRTIQKELPLDLVDQLAYEIPIADNYRASFCPHPEGYEEILFRINGLTIAAFSKKDFLEVCKKAVEHFN